jgi:nucleotide-binding universal stress UspA family protein
MCDDALEQEMSHGRADIVEVNMSTITTLPSGNALLGDHVQVGQGPVIVATDGSEVSRAALDAALQLSYRSGKDVRVITVLEPLPLVAADYMVFVPPPDTEALRRQSLLEQVKQQVVEVAGEHCNWKVELYEGDPPNVVARVAREAKACVIILGIGKHELVDRLLGEETALRTLRRAKAPVLAVPPGFDHLPKRVLIATDFSVASVLAGRSALGLFDTITNISLAHVEPRPDSMTAFSAWLPLYAEGVGPALDRVRAELGIPASVVVDMVRLKGKGSRELLRFARTANIDLIVTGSRGAGMIERMLVGSTATGLLRGAQCAVLAVPSPVSIETPYAAIEPPKERIPEERWAAELSAFTKRNVGRRTSLEVDDSEFGAQAQESEYPLLGVAYDHHDRRVEIMLGDFAGVGRHLTRSITDVHRIDVLRNAQNRDWILRIAHGDGQTVLALQE